MGCSPERRSHFVTNTGLGAIVSLITGEARHLSCFTLDFHWKNILLLIQQLLLQIIILGGLEKEVRNIKRLDLELVELLCFLESC